jgi:hypothetical protein
MAEAALIDRSSLALGADSPPALLDLGRHRFAILRSIRAASAIKRPRSAGVPVVT